MDDLVSSGSPVLSLPPFAGIEGRGGGGRGAVGRRGKVEAKTFLCHFTAHFHRMVVEVEKENKRQVTENE